MGVENHHLASSEKFLLGLTFFSRIIVWLMGVKISIVIFKERKVGCPAAAAATDGSLR